MLPKKFRLTNSEFVLTRKYGRLISSKSMGVLVYCPPQNHREPRGEKGFSGRGFRVKAGLIASKKISPRAVVRHRLKRRWRAALRPVLPLIENSIHFVVLPNHRSLTASVKELEAELKECLKIVPTLSRIPLRGKN